MSPKKICSSLNLRTVPMKLFLETGRGSPPTSLPVCHRSCANHSGVLQFPKCVAGSLVSGPSHLPNPIRLLSPPICTHWLLFILEPSSTPLPGEAFPGDLSWQPHRCVPLRTLPSFLHSECYCHQSFLIYLFVLLFIVYALPAPLTQPEHKPRVSSARMSV